MRVYGSQKGYNRAADAVLSASALLCGAKNSLFLQRQNADPFGMTNKIYCSTMNGALDEICCLLTPSLTLMVT